MEVHGCARCGAAVLEVAPSATGRPVLVEEHPMTFGHNHDGRDFIGKIAVPWENGPAAGERAFTISQYTTVGALRGFGLYAVHQHEGESRGN
jgi:hypothetical protein